MKRILLTGGGTAGHTMPLLAVKEALERRGDFKFFFLGPGAKLEGVPSKNILAAKWRRYFSLKNFFDIFKLPLGFLQAFWHILWFMPKVCFGKGGYGSVPGVLICWLFRIPVVLHESDAIPGAANRFLARFAKTVCLGFREAAEEFPSSGQKKLVFTGNPVRSNILQKKILSPRPVLLVLGGSQGAVFINELISAILPDLLKEMEVIHQTGPGKKSDINLKGYKQIEFIQDMGKAYALADLVVTRAGANTLAELSSLKKPSIIIPLPTAAGNHQLANAYIYSRNQAALVLEQETLGPLTFLEKIITLIKESEILKNMGRHSNELNPMDAGDRIAKVAAEFL